MSEQKVKVDTSEEEMAVEERLKLATAYWVSARMCISENNPQAARIYLIAMCNALSDAATRAVPLSTKMMGDHEQPAQFIN